jgi:hypothetical protein
MEWGLSCAAPKNNRTEIWKIKIGEAFHHKPYTILSLSELQCEFSIKILMLYNH